ncbi:PaaI family thioesterase [Modestobacter sp. Leaf380]|uniref:PaaI family thioesterase n=1 Tax=Modestobacter sp. Leaf380 TaxID=1736356 RepID=UPI001F35F924|nr:PaaI family thioesterase [Modestobacter sp. Leaf380]
MIPESSYDPELMAAVTELGSALRELVGVSVATTVGPDELRAAAARAREITAELGAATRERTRLPVLDDPIAFRRVFSPVTGVGSAIAPPLRVRRTEDGGVQAEATLGLQYEGPPGFLHGGMSGLLMDQMLGAAAIAGNRWGMTAHLALDYRGPVPLDTPLVLRARVTEEQGRKTLIGGSIATAAHPDRALVEVSGVFVTPREEKMGDYFGAITDAAGRHAPPGRATDATALHGDGA